MSWLPIVLALFAGAAAAQQPGETLDDVIRKLLADPVPDRSPLPTVARAAAVLRGLDTFSGEVASFTVPVGGTGRFARMQVRLLACHEVGTGQDAYAFVEIVDGKTPDVMAFRGWLIASNPALSALDHPRFDVWLESCNTTSG
jgi:hypothetical protein